MSSRLEKQDHAILIGLAGLAVAAVGFLLSALATLLAKFTSHPPGHVQPIIKIRDAAVTASTRSPPNSLSPESDSLPDKVPPRSRATKHPKRREKLVIDVKNAERHVEAKQPLTFESSERSPGVTPTQHIIHFLTPTQEIPIISVSPPPTRLSSQSDSSASTATDNQTIISSSSESAASAGPTPTTSPPAAVPEGSTTRGRRLRFSKITQLFSDKRGNSKPRRRESLPAMRSDAAAPSNSSSIPPVPPLPLSPKLSSIPFSPPAAPAAATAATATAATADSPAPILRSKPVSQRPTRRRSLIIRTASCPILRHHSHHSRCFSEEPSVPPIPQSPLPLVQSPTSVKSPVSPVSVRKSKSVKEPVPRPRTQPYAAPYFIPPPDSVDVEEPLTRRRRPSRHRTMPPSEPVSPR
ncbi:hypothetical protein MVEN_01481700 [Mycena venus]|uniref:Uncharacterized protein n=1 Tax=Mycena venus TaxID=2733690 RepID=A0A8H6XVD4_9AGAR|nr:hypothetical protein MVEN_01481700 [Mycena venus]